MLHILLSGRQRPLGLDPHLHHVRLLCRHGLHLHPQQEYHQVHQEKVRPQQDSGSPMNGGPLWKSDQGGQQYGRKDLSLIFFSPAGLWLLNQKDQVPRGRGKPADRRFQMMNSSTGFHAHCDSDKFFIFSTGLRMSSSSWFSRSTFSYSTLCTGIIIYTTYTILNLKSSTNKTISWPFNATVSAKKRE